MVKTVNPATNQVIETYNEMTEGQLDHILSRATDAFSRWKQSMICDRVKLFEKIRDILETRKRECAESITREMGKNISEAEAEISKCVSCCRYFAKNAENLLQEKRVFSDKQEGYLVYEPIGVVLGIMPWNFPFWQVFRAAVTSMIVGNGFILKHASNVTGSALLIEEIFKQAGFPEALFSTVIVSGAKVTYLVEHSKIAGVTFTGSEHAGRQVASLAGKCLKKTVLELGGSDPYIVLDDADVKKAAEICIQRRLLCGGQVCIASKRLIIVDSIYEEFRDCVVEAMKKYKVGDPMDVSTHIGPLARKDLKNELRRQVEGSIEKGALCSYRGEIPVEGNFFPHMLLEGVTSSMPAYSEELFGPVVVLIRAKDEDDAIKIANDTQFGLGAAIFSKDIKRAKRLAEKEIDAGYVAINTAVSSDPRISFGGVKNSGWGRELGEVGLHEFANIKTIVSG